MCLCGGGECMRAGCGLEMWPGAGCDLGEWPGAGSTIVVFVHMIQQKLMNLFFGISQHKDAAGKLLWQQNGLTTL